MPNSPHALRTNALSTFDPDGFIREYEELPPRARIVLHLKAAAGSYAEKDILSKAASMVKIPLPDGKTLTSAMIGDVITQTKRSGLWEQMNEPGSQVRHHVNVAAFQDRQRDLYIDAVKATERPNYYLYYGQTHTLALRQLRFAAYLNDEKAMIANLAQDTPGTWSLLSQFFGTVALEPEWLASRTPVIWETVLMAKLAAFLGTGVPAPDFHAFRDQIREIGATTHNPAARIFVAKFEILSGSPAGAMRILKGLQARTTATEDGKPSDHAVMIASFRQQIEGMAAFLTDRNGDALEHFREALKLFRKAAHKRKIFLSDIEGLLALLCLLRENDPNLTGELEGWIDDAQREGPANPGFVGILAIMAITAITRGNDREAARILDGISNNIHRTPLAEALEDLAEFLLDRQRSKARAVVLRDAFEQFRNTLPLGAKTYAAILEKVSGDPEPYRSYLERPGREPIIRLTEVIHVTEPWQRALDHLETLLVNPAETQEPPRKKGKRLIWLLDPDIGTIEPVEQTAKKDGWNAGRALSFRRVFKNDPPLEMDEDDRRVVDSLYHGYERSHYSYNVSEVFGPDPNKTLLAMVGHPRIFDANERSRQLELVRYPVELVVSEARGGYRIALSHFADAPSVFLEPETPNRYRVIEVSADVVKVGALLGPEGMVVPRDGRERVVGFVRQSLSGALPIRSEIAAVDVPAIEGSPTPVLRLAPV